MSGEKDKQEQEQYDIKKFGEGIKFERIRRITGYISGDYKSRFNNAKLAEVEDRITHDKYNKTESYYNKE